MPNRNPRKQQVLVIDRSRHIRRDIKAFLENSGAYEVMGEASSLAEAIRHVQDVPPDIVLVDVEMAERHGLGVLAELRMCLPSSTRVVATHTDWEEYDKATRAAGAAAAVAKTELFSSLMKALGELSGVREGGRGGGEPLFDRQRNLMPPGTSAWWRPKGWREWFVGAVEFGAALLRGAPMDSSPPPFYWRYMELAILLVGLLILIGLHNGTLLQASGVQKLLISVASFVFVLAEVRQIRRLSLATRAFEKVEERFQNMPREAKKYEKRRVKGMNLVKRLIKEEEGQTYVEYAILVAVLAIAVGATSLFIKDGIIAYFGKINDVLSGANVEPLP